MQETFYITTPIYYPNDKLHIGHTYTTIAADSMARYKKLRGYDVKFLTGMDEHGQKIERSSAERGKTPQEQVDEIAALTKKLWETLEVDFDFFWRTTDPQHQEIAKKMFTRLYEQGDIYKGEYSGMYCTPCESFFSDRQLEGDKCPDCGRACEAIAEEAYFFRLSKYQDQLIAHIEANPEFIYPKSRASEMLNNFLKPGLTDLCVSRTSFTWGIPVEFDPRHVMYVWIDALSNYITALGYSTDHDEMFRKYWPADIHLVGKDIVRFHSIIWPAILMALGLPLPKQIYGHGFLVIDGKRMGKSLGNAIEPLFLVNRYGVDAIRYFLMREISFGQDGNFTFEALVSRINADLANDLGNLLSRTVGMIDKYFGGKLPETKLATDFDEDLIATVKLALPKIENSMDNLVFSDALNEIWNIIRRSNKYVDEVEPWKLVKDPQKTEILAACLYNLAEVLRIVAILISPVLVKTPEIIFEQLCISDPQHKTWDSCHSFGLLPCNVQIKKGDIVFPRLDIQKETESLTEITGG